MNTCENARTTATEKVEELRAESLKFPPNIRRKVNMALDGIEQVIAAKLGGGKLTAEQVHQAVNNHRNIMDNRFYCNWQAIADELNAALGGANVDDALALLDEINEQGRIGYDDYSRLHDAIAASVNAATGCDNRVAERLREIAADMRGIGASSMTPRELFAYWAHEVDKAADLADFLVSMSPDGLPVGLTISEDGSLLDWRGENYVRQSALSGSTLTAHDVWEAIGNHGVSQLQAIADELNAKLGKQKAKAHPYGYEPDTGAFDVTRCECGCLNDISATYCNDCGGKIEIDMNAEKEIYTHYSRNVFATKHDDGSLEFCGKRYIAATLGGGKLTKEDVQRALFAHSTYASYDGLQLYASGIRTQEIADELNATLGGGECTPHGEWESISQTQEVRHVYCECGYELGMDRRDSLPFKRSMQLFAMPNYCQECGRKIRKAMER